ncbi:hypothetical protein ABQF08_20685 [Xanthomonas campestris pv. campestris]|jgi:hypothetical protein|uniref:Uncharacterized protein n=2 Tax=Xanthomonas campestris pv. campestris TaxID=340 RepID=Q8PDK4_XANCP|nr:hypothetical protein [Xanthomonas campestris]AAM39650.1 hypothetical protein XCC0331 [Xanthomonas campestris pv. campestris str. ATCC 33913]AAY47428.1 conserved hypothetical protein [Xanthomonas campestris pv. campestris str. 8004]AKS14753.1 hypothetical protein AEA00_01665 [Xanthomonas campestris pv. campestris]AKS18771.1 hypothetical protein AEA01_01640 [Xanthomonas campestris pv. campestris]ALE67300.1 hypothetical protein AAW18_01620 [Xanthomonas campestris pv. campestris]
MTDTIDTLLQDDPDKWVGELPEFQRSAIQELRSAGSSYEDIAQAWITASAENTYRFSASAPVGDKGAFLDNLRSEIRAFLCGDKKYKKERDGLFGEKGLARTYVVSAMAVAIAPQLSVAAAVIAPLIALVLASVGKVALNAWCASQPGPKP